MSNQTHMAADPMAAIRTTFFQECDDQLAALEEGLMAIEAGDHSSETVNAVFRAVHSVKGGAGAFQLATLVEFAHAFESVLDKIRSNGLEVTPQVTRALLKSSDVLADLVADAKVGRSGLNDLQIVLMQELIPLAEGTTTAASDEDEAIDFQPILIAVDSDVPSDVDVTVGSVPKSHLIKFTPKSELYSKGNDAVAILRELHSLGRAEVDCILNAVPELSRLDPHQNYLSWSVILSSDASESRIREVFEFVDGDCEFSIENLETSPTDHVVAKTAVNSTASAEELPTNDHPAATAEVLKITKSSPDSSEHPKQTGGNTLAPPPTIRVDLSRVDRLINLVGELVINQSMLSQRITTASFGKENNIRSSLSDFEQLTREIQESVMAIRAQPVKSLFQRMSRVVREVSDATGKKVRLITVGESTEVDKTVVEMLSDPLTHMIRNAVDHGIETPEKRLQAGKPEEGTIRVSAAHRSGRIVIEIADDGGGINRPRVRAAAESKGLISADAKLTDGEIDNLLFLPGFSTAATVSSISGRGVGMDVVKRSIQALGGRISISSKSGKGSVFSLSLPLTLAVLDGIVTQVEGHTFVVPLTSIIETSLPTRRQIYPFGDGAHVIKVRDQFIPLCDVGVHLNLRSSLPQETDCIAVLVETDHGQRSALLVDSIQEQRQVVIKSLEANFGAVPGVAAATILGDGRVAMILDVESLVGKVPEDVKPVRAELAQAS